jgi:hypothetical protein
VRRGKIVRNLLISTCLFSALALAQSYTGSIRGTITDNTKAPVPGARITATDADRNVDYSTVTDTSGRYSMPTLPAARYTLSVTAQGFDKATQPAFQLEVQQQATIDVELKVGSVTTTVEVQALAPILNTTSATLGQVVENKIIMTLPQNTRNPLGLIQLAPGVVTTGSGTNFVSSGVRNNASEILMDGGPLTGIEQNGGVTDVKYTPTMDVVEEFKVQTNFFSAEFGNSGGTVVNMVSKSGTNQVHGVGYYFRRDNAMNANNWFSNARNSPLADSKRDNYGATVGGPVILPKIYNGKNRTFFFGDYDRISALSATTSLGSVPTAQQLSGDFSDTRLANGNVVPLFDPYSTFKDANGNTLRNPIPGNIIPASRQNPITLAFIKFYPAPNQPGNPFTRVNNWFGQGSTPSNGNKADVKIDHNFSEKQRLSARYGVNWTYNGVANLTGNISHNGNPGTERDQNFILDYTRTQSPTTVITLRAGVLRVKSIRDPLSTGFDATTLGLPAYMTAATGTKAFPQFSAQYRSMGAGGFAIIHRYEDVYQYMGSVTKIFGGHTLKAGVEFRKLHENYYQPNTPNGSFTFSRNTTAQNPTVSSSTQGDGLASALLGWGSGGQVSIDYPTAQSSGYFGTYLNEDWRVSRKLTVNLGLRYDFDIPRTDRFNRINWMDLNAPAPIADVPQIKALYPNLKGVMRFADDDHRTPYSGDWNNVQPRVGFAYALNNKTSIRGAYGIFYVVSRHTIKGEVGTAFGFTDSSIPWSLDSGLTQFASFTNPWPAGLTFPPGKNASFFLGMGAGTPLPQDDNPQYQQWTMSVQRELPGQGVIEVNYVGTKGTHLYFGTNDVVSNLDVLYPTYWSLGRGTSGTGLNALVANPFYGIITNPVATTYNQPTIQLRRLLTPYPEYTSVGGYRASRNIANSIYHALQVKYEKRFSRGLSMIAHYTFSKMISDSDESGSDVDFFAGGSSVQDIFNLRNERSLSTFDRTHRVLVSFDYQLPVGRGRSLGKGMNKLLDGVIGGWEVSTIISGSSGAPLGVTQSASNLWNSANQRPNLVGDPSIPGSTRDKLNQYFNVNAFSQVNPDIIGSSPRFLSNYRGPVLWNTDAALMKNFNIRERKYVQLRLEGYAVKNAPQWGMPNTSFGDTSFGQITSSTGQRTLQVAAKFYY